MVSSQEVERYDLSQYIALKGVIERVLGGRAFAEIKESRSLSAWRRHALRLVKGSRLAIQVTVKVCDPGWRGDVERVLTIGERRIRSASSVEDVVASLASTYIELSFLQVGLMPHRPTTTAVQMRSSDWKLDAVRCVQYVQTGEQLEAQAWADIQREVGVRRSLDLHLEWRVARLDMPFSEWYRLRLTQDGPESR